MLRYAWLLYLIAGLVWGLGGCDDDKKKNADAGADAAADGGDADTDEDGGGPPPDPGEEFDEFCQGAEWDESLEPAMVHELGGEYAGYYGTFGVAGTQETMKVVPEHPFHAKTIRLSFAGGDGPARIRLMKSFGRSYPDTVSGEGDLIEPVEIQVSESDADTWIEIDITGADVKVQAGTEGYTHYTTQIDRLTVRWCTRANNGLAIVGGGK